MPARTRAEFLELCQGEPDSLTYASHGPGSVSQLVGEMLKLERGVRLLEVPYKGVNSELPDLQGGQLSRPFPCRKWCSAPSAAESCARLP